MQPLKTEAIGKKDRYVAVFYECDKNNIDYKPKKSTALSFAIALELSLDETLDLIGRAGFTLSHSSKFDVIIEFFLQEGIYDMFTINNALFAFGEPTLTD